MNKKQDKIKKPRIKCEAFTFVDPVGLEPTTP